MRLELEIVGPAQREGVYVEHVTADVVITVADEHKRQQIADVWKQAERQTYRLLHGVTHG